MIAPVTRDSWNQLTSALRGFVARRVRDQDADDVVQDTLLRIHRGLPALRDGQRFGPWVYRVARNTITDHLRYRSRAPVVAPASPNSEDVTAPPAEDEEEFQQELLRCLSRFVADLAAPYREAITLTELEGLTQAEAAAMLDVSVSGMKSRVQRGRGLLREMFEACCVLNQDARGRVVQWEPRGRDDDSLAGCGPDGGCSPARPAAIFSVQKQPGANTLVITEEMDRVPLGRDAPRCEAVMNKKRGSLHAD